LRKSYEPLKVKVKEVDLL